jgi:ATP-dependent Clp protease ATP-binding subunit ClpB
MAQIVDIQLGRLDKLLAPRGITVELDDAALTFLANKGYDPAYGARPLKRVIQTELQNPLAEALLKGEITDKMNVKISYDGTSLSFKGDKLKKDAAVA